jgi:hypothetical protein
MGGKYAHTHANSSRQLMAKSHLWYRLLAKMVVKMVVKQPTEEDGDANNSA